MSAWCSTITINGTDKAVVFVYHKAAHQVVQEAVFFCAIFIDNWYFGTNEIEGVDVAAVSVDHFYDLVGVRVIPHLPFNAAHLVVRLGTIEVVSLSQIVVEFLHLEMSVIR